MCISIPADSGGSARGRLRQGPRPIRGGSDRDSDAGRLTALLHNGARCLDCLAKQSGKPTDEVQWLLGHVGSVVAVVREAARCEGCLKVTIAYRLRGSAERS